MDDNQETLEDIKNKMLESARKQKEENILPQIKAVQELFNKEEKEYTRLYRNPENVKFVLDAMFGSTNEQWGTSFSSRIEDPKYQFAGKTGTAQVKRITEEARELDLKTSQIPYKERDHALYVAFGPYVNPRYALSILIEHGGSGGKAAAPMAKELFKLIIDRHEFREMERKKNLVVS
tara:strand:- start:304 stop:837 length:534 start_codon:yes stop_codon:yes gene_type:complete